ncbi:hypothetical protein L917_07610 [Phytophthora nicotianae]|uniref:Uncharacterized protein n=2 Tax=Phytophthora nicotianae TaxID=4792 RepID=W2HQZ0_PHYNI|nr:hypothetical protein L915_21716 [Phytophthora nicotianae]ETL24266.1 hypothetical protein L916_21721 [Phytophthora nicotianae]ETL94417.1 hypothetical protein L917_07610 [Phytophthora nicotianae]ETM44745.1 hypothetical protein L914_10048 [Phytophthora nicotianae]ETO59042.1 hypothetical protein F444_22580 [Phytophthora nicotianae P1976]
MRMRKNKETAEVYDPQTNTEAGATLLLLSSAASA